MGGRFTPVPAFTTARRTFPTDTNGTTKIWLAGGYAPATPVASMEIFTGGAPVPSSAVSRKVHGAFTGDINLPLVPIEWSCRDRMPQRRGCVSDGSNLCQPRYADRCGGNVGHWERHL